MRSIDTIFNVTQGSVIYGGIEAVDKDEPNTPFSIVQYSISDVYYCIPGPCPNEKLFELNEPVNGVVNILAARSLFSFYGEYEVEITVSKNKNN